MWPINYVIMLAANDEVKCTIIESKTKMEKLSINFKVDMFLYSDLFFLNKKYKVFHHYILGKKYFKK